MSLQTRLSALITAIGADIKALNTAVKEHDPDLEPIQAGVLRSIHGVVTRVNANSIQVAAGRALVPTLSGLLVVVSWAQQNITIPNATAGNARIDQLYVDLNGTLQLNSSSNFTDTGGTVHSDAFRIPMVSPFYGTVLWEGRATSTGIGVFDGNNQRDRRARAKGNYLSIVRHANASNTSNYSTTNGTPQPIDATNLSPRFECSGKPVRVSLRGFFEGVGANPKLRLLVDGSLHQHGGETWAPQSYSYEHISWEIPNLTPGSHVFTPDWAPTTNGQAINLYADTITGQNRMATLVLEEIMR